MSDQWPRKAWWNTVSGILYTESINKNCIPVLVYPADQAPKPVAWMRDDGLENPIWAITNRIRELWMKAKPEQVERYTIPLYLAPPSESAIRASERERIAAMIEVDPIAVGGQFGHAVAAAIRELGDE